MNVSPDVILQSQQSSLPEAQTAHQESKIASIAIKVLAVLAVGLAGAGITVGASIALAPFGPVAVAATVATGVALTVLGMGLTAYLLFRSDGEYRPIPQSPSNGPKTSTSASTDSPLPVQLIDGLGSDTATVCRTLAKEAVKQFEAFNAPVNGHKVEKYAHSLIESQNRFMLHKLNERLKKEVGDTVASTIMNDWDLIGHDIRLNNTLLDDERIDEIIVHAKKAQELKEDKDGYRAQLNVLKGKLASGEMPARKLVIEKNFPLLAELLGNDAQRKKELDTLLKEAAVRQQMRKAPLFKPSVGERDIFGRLGLPTEHIDPLKIPDSLSRKIALVLLESSPFFEKGEEEFISQVRNHVKKHAIEERIDQMLQNDTTGKVQKAKERVEHVQDLIGLRDHLNGRICRERREAINDLSESLEQFQQCEDERLKKMMKASLSSDVSKNSRVVMNTFLNEHSDDIDAAIEGDAEAKSYHERLGQIRDEYATQHIQTLLEDVTKAKLPNLLNWYHKWNDHIEIPFAQGFDDANSVLGQGVCYAMSLRLLSYELSHPDMATEDLAKHVQIEPQDRFFQALYEASDKSILDDKILSHVGLRNLQTVDRFPSRDEDFLDKDKLLQHLSETVRDSEKWKETNGTCSIALHGGKYDAKNKKILNGWGHSIHTRVDEDRAIYRFLDPNFGLLKFSNAEDLTQCLRELVLGAYNDTLILTFESYSAA